MPNLRDRVKCAITGTPTASVGTALTLGSAASGARSFSTAYGASVSNITVVVDDGANWQTGVASYNNSAGTLSFTTIDASSSGGTAITLSGSASVSVEYLSRDHDADWPFMEVIYSGTGVGTSANAFTTLTIPTVVNDTHNGYSTSTNYYTVPQTGTYDILLKFRFQDGNIGGAGYGLGVDSSNSDTAAFSWYQGNSATRQGVLYRRVSPFNAGDNLRAFYYLDGFSVNYTSADLAIFRVR